MLRAIVGDASKRHERAVARRERRKLQSGVGEWRGRHMTAHGGWRCDVARGEGGRRRDA